MTSRVVREEPGSEHAGRVKEIVISCDQMDCQTAANDTTIRASGGLKKMGWQALYQNSAMRHYCPEHNRSKGVRD